MCFLKKFFSVRSFRRNEICDRGEGGEGSFGGFAEMGRVSGVGWGGGGRGGDILVDFTEEEDFGFGGRHCVGSLWMRGFLVVEIRT